MASALKTFAQRYLAQKHQMVLATIGGYATLYVGYKVFSSPAKAAPAPSGAADAELKKLMKQLNLGQKPKAEVDRAKWLAAGWEKSGDNIASFNAWLKEGDNAEAWAHWAQNPSHTLEFFDGLQQAHK